LYQISIDGDRDQHNTTRVTVRGGDTFDRILGNIKDAIGTSYDFKIALRVHLHERNVEGMGRLLSLIVELFERDPRVTVYFKAIERLGGANDQSFPFLARSDEVGRLARQAQDLGILERSAKQPACYAAMANSLVIRADGRIAKCTVALRDQRNIV